MLSTGDGASDEISTKKTKIVKWEWLGDGGKWMSYSEEISEKLTDLFVSGVDEVTIPVSQGVKMKIRFKSMTQCNISTGWARDIHCISDSDQSPAWEWEEGGVWKRWVVVCVCVCCSCGFRVDGHYL